MMPCHPLAGFIHHLTCRDGSNDSTLCGVDNAHDKVVQPLPSENGTLVVVVYIAALCVEELWREMGQSSRILRGSA